MNAFGAIAHHNYLCMKIPAPEGVIMVHGDQDLAQQTELEADPPKHCVHTLEVNSGASTGASSGKWAPKAKPEGQLRRIPLRDASPEKIVALGAELQAEEHDVILGVLRSNADVFAWSPEDIPRVAKETIEHRLAVRSDAAPKKQKLRRMTSERLEAAKEEIAKLLKTRVIREVKHSEWLANPVLVQKSTGKWPMCVDFIDLNKVSPKDDSPCLALTN